MEIIIRETGKCETLSIIDNKTGVDYINDFVGNHGALDDGQFDFDADRGVYVCNQETFEWWDAVAADHQKLECRINALINEHGSEAVREVIEAAGSFELEDYAANINNALDDAFGDD